MLGRNGHRLALLADLRVHGRWSRAGQGQLKGHPQGLPRHQDCHQGDEPACPVDRQTAGDSDGHS